MCCIFSRSSIQAIVCVAYVYVVRKCSHKFPFCALTYTHTYMLLKVHSPAGSPWCLASLIVVAYLNQTMVYDWCVLNGFENEHKKGMCVKEIGLHVQNVNTISSSIKNIIFGGGGGGLHNNFKRKNLNVDNAWDIHMSSTKYEENGYPFSY